MKIGIVQSGVVWENKEKNLQALEQMLPECAENGVDCVFLPEMSFTGFSMNTKITAETDEHTLKRVSELAKDYALYIGFGWVKESGGRRENRYTVAAPTGCVISDYAKCHPFFPERDFISRGDSLETFQINGITFGTQICYDLRFPEPFRVLSNACGVIVVPANWPKQRREHWMTLLRARAIENQIYLIGVNCFGEIGGLEYSGDSCVINPDGEAVFQAAAAPGLYIYDLTDDTAEFRRNFPAFRDRRAGWYAALYGDIK